MPENKTMAERVARIEEWVEGHEVRCEDRQRTLGREIGELKSATGGLTKGAWAVALALLSFAGAQVYDGLKNHPMTVSAAVATSANPAPHP